MKKISATLIVFFAYVFILNAQNNNSITVFTEGGERFFLIINGIKQNANAETSVKVSGINGQQVKAKVIFEQKGIPDCDKTIPMMWAAEDLSNTEFVFSIKKNRKGQYKWEYVSHAPIQGATTNTNQNINSNQVNNNQNQQQNFNSNNNSNYNSNQNSINQNTNVNGNQNSITTTTTSTTTTNNGTGNGNSGVGINIGFNGTGINMNMNVNDGSMGNNVNTTTTTTTTSYTTTNTSNGVTQTNTGTNVQTNANGSNINMNTNMNGMNGQNSNFNSNTNFNSSNTNNTTNNSNFNNNSNQNNFNNNNAGCFNAMSAAEFNDAKKSIQSKPFDDTKLKIAKQVADNNCLSVEQIKGVIALFSFEDNKLDFAKYAYDRCTEKRNYYKVGDVFTFDSNVQELNDYIDSKK
ncbi:MAG: DUF4476 domain-containing protein [Bacteroidota bacterium]|jgi:hypothetical protein